MRMELVYGSVRQMRCLQWLMRRLTTREPDRRVRGVLLVALYELFGMGCWDDAHAVVHEAVEAAKGLAGIGAAGFANAVLRRAIREREALERALKKASIGVRESHPEILVKRWRQAFGAASMRRLLAWDNEPAPVVVRMRGDEDAVELLEEWGERGVHVTRQPAWPRGYWALSRGVRVSDLAGYAEGRFFVQDPLAAVAVRLLGAAPGDRVLDACAAPGGKTALIADAMGGRGELVAMDLHEDRLRLLASNLDRLGLGWVRVTPGDAAAPGPAVAATGFDRVLADVPCTNTGVLRRRPDARWRFGEKRLAALTAAQHRILDGLAGIVRPGGVLVYSTCSLEPEEGIEGVRAWASGHADFAVEEAVRVFPPTAATDGGSVVRLRKKDIAGRRAVGL